MPREEPKAVVDALLKSLTRRIHHAHRGHLHRRRGPDGKIVNTNFSYITQKLEGRRSRGPVGDDGRDDRENLLLAFKLAGSAPTRSSSTAASGRRSTICPRRSRPAAGVSSR